MSEPKQVLSGTLLEYIFLDDYNAAGFLDLKVHLFSPDELFTQRARRSRCRRFYLKPAQLNFRLRVHEYQADSPMSLSVLGRLGDLLDNSDD